MLQQVREYLNGLPRGAHRMHGRNADARAHRPDYVTLELGRRVDVRVQVLDELFDHDRVLLLHVVHEDQEYAAHESRVLPAARLVGVQVAEDGRDYLADCGVVGLACQVLEQHFGFVVRIHELLAGFAMQQMCRTSFV